MTIPLRQEQPADGMPWAAAGHHRPDDAGRQRRHRRGDRERGQQGDVGPAGVTYQLVEPQDTGEQEQLEREQRPGQHGRPAAGPRRWPRLARPGRIVHRRHPASDPAAVLSLGRGQYRGSP
jgi:hypothetical protein